MANMNIAGPPKPGMPPMPQQYQQYAAFNNNQAPPGTLPVQSIYPTNNNNNNQLPPTNGMQNGAGQMMPPQGNKVPLGQFSPTNNPPTSQLSPGFPSQPQAPQIQQQGQRPPIPGEPAHQNGHTNGPEMPRPPQAAGLPPTSFNSQPQQARPPMQGMAPPMSSPSQMPPHPGHIQQQPAQIQPPTAQQYPGQVQQTPAQQFPGMAPASVPGMSPMPTQQTSAPAQHPGMPPMPARQPVAAQSTMPPMPGQMMGQQGFPQQPPMPGQPMQVQQMPGQPPMPGQPMQAQQMPNQFAPQQGGMPPHPQQQPFPPGAMPNRQNFNQPPGMYPQQPAQFQQQPAQFQQQPGQFPQQQPGQFPQQPGMAPQYPASPMQAAPQRRLDPDQMPNPIQVMAENQRTAGGAFSTLQVGQIPPLVTTDFVTQDQGNSGPRYVRSTMYNVPANTDMMKQSAVPFALVVSPFARSLEGEMAPPIVDFGEIGPIRCIRCKAYMSPHMQFTDAGRRFQCLLCKATTEGKKKNKKNFRHQPKVA